MIQVDKGVPLPSSGGGRRITAPEVITFEGMSVGESFQVDAVHARSVRSAIAQHCRRHNQYHYTSALQHDSSGKMWLRIWKTEPKENHAS